MKGQSRIISMIQICLKCGEQSHLEISVFGSWALDAALNLCLLHRMSHLRSLVLYIFVKQVTLSKLANYRLEICNFVRKERTKVSRKKNLKLLKRAILQNPCSKTFVVKFIFNRIVGIDSRPAPY